MFCAQLNTVISDVALRERCSEQADDRQVHDGNDVTECRQYRAGSDLPTSLGFAGSAADVRVSPTAIIERSQVSERAMAGDVPGPCLIVVGDGSRSCADTLALEVGSRLLTRLQLFGEPEVHLS